jgi:hypothetical protein
MSVNCIPVQPEDVPFVWPCVSHFIQMAIDEMSERLELDDVLKLIEQQKAQLFVFKDSELLAALVTTIESSGSHKWLRVMWAGGKELDSWKHYLAALEQWAKSLGCDRSLIFGRRGWERKLKDYTRTAIILEKVL